MHLPDFDRDFSEYLRKWMHGQKAKPEVLEAMVPDEYMKWLNTPADFLDGATPATYYGQETDSAKLLELLFAYLDGDVPVPGPLQDRLAELADPAPLAAYLHRVLADTVTHAGEEKVMTVISLLREMSSDAAAADYIAYIAANTEPNETADACAEALADFPGQQQAVMTAVEKADSEQARMALLDAASHMGPNADAVRWLKRLFLETNQHKAVFAGLLALQGDDSVLPVLIQSLEGSDLSYLDYLEIRHAVEALGGTCPADRDFSGDKDYEALKNLTD